MSAQFVYIVNTAQGIKSDKFTIRGPIDEVYKFQKLSWLKYNLLIDEDIEIAKVNRDTPLSYIYKLKFLNNTNLINIKLYCKPFSNYKIVGTYRDETTSKDISWTWLPSNDDSGCFILTDNNNHVCNLVLARMCGLSLEGLDSGILCITQNVEEYLHQTILITSCLIWEIKS
jgi:hypothetical protein